MFYSKRQKWEKECKRRSSTIEPYSMSPKLHLHYALVCITLHKNEKCKKMKINILHFFAPYYLAFRRRERDLLTSLE
jgi:hypothetical protein